MTIHIDEEANQTLCRCDHCGATESTNRGNGVAVAGWMTGHLWLDISLSEQKQIPICFCPACSEAMKIPGSLYTIDAIPPEGYEPPEPTPEIVPTE